MRKIRIHCDQHLSQGASVKLSEYNSKHLCKVLRKKIGDEIYLFNENDGQWRCVITLADKKSVIAQVLQYEGKNNIDAQIDLYFSPVKNPDSTWIIQKATELGVKKIYPFASDRSVIKSVNMQKLEASANDATQQSERTDMPTVHNLMPFKSMLQIKYDKVLFFDESGRGEKPSEISDGGKIAIIIGCEGGFTEHERESIYAIENCQGISLPHLILRAETAIVAAISLIQSKIGIWS